MRICVIGVDPGELTGLASYSNPRLGSDKFFSTSVVSDDITPILRTWLGAARRLNYVTLVGCEDFVVGHKTSKMSRQPKPLQILGMVRQLAADDHADFAVQDVASAKKIGNPDVLRRLGWWKTGKDLDHANDAAAHVLLAMARRAQDVFKELIV